MKEKRLFLLVVTLLVALVALVSFGVLEVLTSIVMTGILVVALLIVRLTYFINSILSELKLLAESTKKVEKKLIETRKVLLRNQNKERRALYASVESLIGVNDLIKPRAPLPTMAGWAISSDSAKAIIEIFNNNTVKKVLDIGSGTSSVIFGYLLEGTKGASVVSVDHDINFSEITKNNLKIHGLSDIVKVYSKPLKKQIVKNKTYIWYDLPDIEDIDMVLVDGPPAKTQKYARYPALPLVYSKLSKKAIVILDDYDREDEREVVRRWLKEYPDFTLEEIRTDKGLAVLYRNKD